MDSDRDPNYGVVPSPDTEAYPEADLASLRADAEQILARYPQKRSALLPLLHLVQSVDGYVSPRGIDLCADLLGLTGAEVSGVATFYTQFKRHPNGTYTVGVCTNTLCAIMGGDEIWDSVSKHLDIGHDETTADGLVTLERIECNAACDYAPVVMANWEFFDNQTVVRPRSAASRRSHGFWPVSTTAWPMRASAQARRRWRASRSPRPDLPWQPRTPDRDAVPPTQSCSTHPRATGRPSSEHAADSHPHQVLG